MLFQIKVRQISDLSVSATRTNGLKAPPPIGHQFWVNTRFCRYLHCSEVILSFHRILNLFKLIFRFETIWSRIAASASPLGLQLRGKEKIDFIL